MTKKPDNKLTKDEEKLLIISAKLYAAIQECLVHPPVTDEHHMYWLKRLTAEMVCD
jgi:hypothetical protein